jgi:hypothetical protein
MIGETNIKSTTPPPPPLPNEKDEFNVYQTAVEKAWQAEKEKSIEQEFEKNNISTNNFKSFSLINAFTGKEVQVSFGWSWFFFISPFLFGIPLFLKKLNLYGIIAILFNIILISSIAREFVSDIFISAILYAVYSIFLGIKGNKISAKNYLKKDYTFHFPDSAKAKIAKLRWNI